MNRPKVGFVHLGILHLLAQRLTLLCDPAPEVRPMEKVIRHGSLMMEGLNGAIGILDGK